MSQLLMHPRTRLQIDSFVANPSHAVILLGPNGSGKGSVARRLAESLLCIDSGALESHAYTKIVEGKDGKAVGIEDIRGLDQFLSLKVPGKDITSRIILIEASDQMAHEAQNALLKTLEEPPKGTVIILTASYAEGLLTTIRSRSQSILIQAPALKDTKEYFYELYDQARVNKTLAIAGGLPGLLASLLEDESHPLLDAVDEAKVYVRGTTFERLVQSDMLAKDRNLTVQMLYILQQMAHISLQSAEAKSAKRWQVILEASHNASKALHQNAQIKLVLTNMALSI